MLHQSINSNKNSNRRWTTTYTCSDQSCREKNRFEAERILSRFVKNNNGATQKQYGFFCRKCSIFTPIPHAAIPPRLIIFVKNESDWLETKATKTAFYYGNNPEVDDTLWIKGSKGRAIIEKAFANTKKTGKIVGVKRENDENKRITLDVADVDMQNILAYLEKTQFFMLSIAYIDTEERLNRFIIDNQCGASIL